ncbi:hypothetical protein H7I76_26435 [Mycolicibacterium vaccae]|nr:hypothetical protein [Mycolicibacterium vaccae]
MPIGAGVTGQFVGQHRPQKRRVHQATPEFLCHDRDFDPGCTVGAQRPPAGCLDLLVQSCDSFAVGECLN